VGGKRIEDLVSDIYALFNDDRLSISDDSAVAFGQRLAHHIRNRINDERRTPVLRLSNLGSPCNRKLWYSINTPGDGEKLPAEARIKFLFGDILEELLLFLAQEAGHLVTGQQDEVNVNGVVGHRDAVIDGRLVDCKSASSYSFKKFQANGLREDDPFGYLVQLGAYLHGSAGDGVVQEHDLASFLVIDKQLGKITLDTYAKSDIDYDKMVDDKRAMLAQPEPPPREYKAEPDGKSGNMALGVACSYCPFKAKCWPDMRTFIYSSGPKFLTKVVNVPRVPEVDSNGDIVERF
jgi:hypothetical protein